MLFSSVVKADDIDPSNWMAGLDDAARITRISIPGTHDSAADTYHCSLDPNCLKLIGFVATQTYEITDQLAKGIRFFDIRLAYEDDLLKFYHGNKKGRRFYLGQQLSDAIDAVQAHLKSNPYEFVIFLIKQEYNPSDISNDTFWKKIYEQLDDYDYNELFYFSQHGVPTVGEVQGKIVIMAREKPSDYPGSSDPYHVEWSDNTVHYEGHDGHLLYVVEDHYSLATVGTDTKFAEIMQNLYLAGYCDSCCNPMTLFITFLSGEGDVLGKGPSHYAEYENLHTATWLREKGGPHPGIVVMDFAGDSDYSGDWLIQEVIKQNFWQKQP